MKAFEWKQIAEAIAYAQSGNQAVHVFRHGDRLTAHLLDQDIERLCTTARRLGVRVIEVMNSGTHRQHIDLWGEPLVKALARCRKKQTP